MWTPPPVTPMLRPDISDSAPPDPLVPLPTDMRLAPPRPPEPVPLPTPRLPLLPAFDDPELNTSRPLDPLDPLFAETILTCPLLDAVPSLPTTATLPPDTDTARPASTSISAPDPLVPLPEITNRAPLLPALATCDPISIDPPLPDFEEPVLKANQPVLPLVPPFDDIHTIDPLLDAVPSPAPISTTPPLSIAALPEINSRFPPAELVPLPTQIPTTPARPPVEVLQPK